MKVSDVFEARLLAPKYLIMPIMTRTKSNKNPANLAAEK